MSKKPDRDDVLQMVGDVDDAVVVAILETGAQHVDIEQAVRWATGEEPLAATARSQNPAAAAVYDILVSDPAFLPPGDEMRR